VAADVCRSQGNLATPVNTAVVSIDATGIEKEWNVFNDLSTRHNGTVTSTNKHKFYIKIALRTCISIPTSIHGVFCLL
jgi:hypothetical protein